MQAVAVVVVAVGRGRAAELRAVMGQVVGLAILIKIVRGKESKVLLIPQKEALERVQRTYFNDSWMGILP
jgi:hypothetical protein